jgi:hypothetical protein
MEFGLIEAGPDFVLIAKIAVLFLGLSIFIMIYLVIIMPSRYLRIRRQILSLIEPILAQIKKGCWEPGDLTFPEAKDRERAAYAEALRADLAVRGPISIIESLNKTIDLVGLRFKRTLHYSRLMGWSVCLVGFVGALGQTKRTLRAAVLMKDLPLGVFAYDLYWSSRLLEVALIIGLIFLAISYLGQSRLSSLYIEVSDRILKAVEEKTTQALKS